ncbi:uncharacterized protein LOC108914842 [Anoplophora glabripennis]|uniref:uncharacterized protein LOC108914842 n=1 Tax=Anoplophora glabripennis TaxID=217634 RepID=UPI0008739C7C|nr:uncharacterized protein LOC108914842 [Anoplophora glabripennis]
MAICSESGRLETGGLFRGPPDILIFFLSEDRAGDFLLWGWEDWNYWKYQGGLPDVLPGGMVSVPVGERGRSRVRKGRVRNADSCISRSRRRAALAEPTNINK